MRVCSSRCKYVLSFLRLPVKDSCLFRCDRPTATAVFESVAVRSNGNWFLRTVNSYSWFFHVLLCLGQKLSSTLVKACGWLLILSAVMPVVLTKCLYGLEGRPLGTFSPFGILQDSLVTIGTSGRIQFRSPKPVYAKR